MVKKNEYLQSHLHYITFNFIRNIYLCTYKGMECIKMNSNEIDSRYYIIVASKMKENNIYPRPRLKRTVLVTGWNEWLQIKTVGTGR